MNDAIVELIVAHVVSLLEGALVIPSTGRGMLLAESQLPSVVVTPLSHDPSENNGSICLDELEPHPGGRYPHRAGKDLRRIRIAQRSIAR